MATSLTPPSLTECGICLSEFKEPKLLACSHTYCLTCLEDVIKSQARGRYIKCPECRKNIQVSCYILSYARQIGTFRNAFGFPWHMKRGLLPIDRICLGTIHFFIRISKFESVKIRVGGSGEMSCSN